MITCNLSRPSFGTVHEQLDRVFKLNNKFYFPYRWAGKRAWKTWIPTCPSDELVIVNIIIILTLGKSQFTFIILWFSLLMTCLGLGHQASENEIKVFCLAEKFTTGPRWKNGPVLSIEGVKYWDSTVTGWENFTWGAGNIIINGTSPFIVCVTTLRMMWRGLVSEAKPHLKTKE